MTNFKRYILVGVPGSGKTKLAEELAQTLDAEIVGSPEDVLNPDYYTLGPQLDYRAELLLASHRAATHVGPNESEAECMVFDGSLVDNLAYVIRRCERDEKYKSVDEKTELTNLLLVPVIGAMLVDSFKYDHVFFLESEGEDEETRLLQARMKEILDELVPDHTVLRADEREKWGEQVKAKIG